MERLKREDCEMWKRIKVWQGRGENWAPDPLGPKHMATENIFERKEITVGETEGSKGASGLW